MNDKKSEILNSGKELFSLKGFKETNVAEIMKQAGMATGTFYNYFSSKDTLFMEIFKEENIKLKREILNSLNLEENPAQVIKEMLQLNFQGMIANPILKEWYNKEVFNKIERNFRDENGLESVDFLYDTFTAVIKKWQSEGKIRNDMDAEMIMAMFSSIVVVETHKEEIGLKYFPQALEYLTEFTMKGLMER